MALLKQMNTGVTAGVAVWLAVQAGGGVGAAPLAPAAPPAAVRFNRDIRPILSENCLPCHGPDAHHRKAKLRLDVREVALARKAFVPGQPDQSELIRRIFTADADDHMPPAESHRTLTRAQKELLRQWIAQGAVYEPHWAYAPLRRPAAPVTRDPGWVRNPIDAFVLQELAARGIHPSPPADQRTLLRRLSLDLTGLPPTVAETEAFLRDRSPRAYERQVDRLLASPHYGERMAVAWLDVARFADTVGYHGDQNVNDFPYRDYVIDSFNQNKPFDQFTIEQLAGDLLPHPTVAQEVATGFNRLNMVTREGGAQPAEYLAKYAADRVRTVATTWLGSTMACCECHDHKFDPFTTKDFYSMEAFFADIKQWGVYSDYDYTPNPDLKGWSNDHPFPPELVVDSPYLHRRLARLEGELARLCQTNVAALRTQPAARAAFARWQQTSRAWLARWRTGWMVPVPAVRLTPKGTNTTPSTTYTVRPDSSILFAGKPGDKIDVWLAVPAGQWAALRLELMPDPSHNGSIVRGEEDKTSVALTARLENPEGGRGTPLRFYDADADHKEDHYANGAAVVGVRNQWTTAIAYRRSPQTAVWLLDPPLSVSQTATLVVSLGGTAVGRARLSLAPFAPADARQAEDGGALAKALATPAWRRSRRAQALVAAAYLRSTASSPAAFARYKALENEILECRDGRSPTVVTVAWKPRVTRVLPRGNWQDQSGEVVEPATPAFLPALPNPAGHRLTRLDLARWLVAPENPLTARATVNRLWGEFFGQGLSGVVNDLGTQGDWPTHPELLDWLAADFRDDGWNVKHLVKLMVMSSTYQQDSRPRPDLAELDPDNRLLARQEPRRLEAEFVRDNALDLAGLLNPDLGGPSIFPYQPAGYYANLQFPDRHYQADRDDRQYRRGVYIHWQRTFLQPMLANFDAPSREECTALRTVSNTPQQALTLLNDPTFVEAARVFAARLLEAQTKSDAARLNLAFEEALARPIRANEEVSLAKFLAAQRAHYEAEGAEARKVLKVGLAPAPTNLDARELAAWTSVARVILNLNETITRY